MAFAAFVVLIDVLPTGILFGDTSVTAHIDNSELVVQTEGVRQSVITIAQQLAWLGAALRSSPSDSHIASCEPRIWDINTDEGGYPRFRINFDVRV